VQIDAEPSIRTNTTVLLGNLAPHLGDAYCKKVGNTAAAAAAAAAAEYSPCAPFR
jgi:hypothetical protein